MIGSPGGFSPESAWGIPLGYPGVPWGDGFDGGNRPPWGHGFVFGGYDVVFGRFFVLVTPGMGSTPPGPENTPNIISERGF